MEILSSDKGGLQQAVELLQKGGIGAFPTDTVYGLGARIDSEAAIRKIFKAKGRSAAQPLPILIAEIGQLHQIAAQIPPSAWKLAERFWPGGLTLVLPKAPQISELISAGGSTIAVRLPKHPVPMALISGLGIPIIGTSANISGQPSPVTAKEVIAQLDEKLDFVIDGGRCPGGKESTIIDLTQQPPRILREGAIAIKEIEKAAGTPFDLCLAFKRRGITENHPHLAAPIEGAGNKSIFYSMIVRIYLQVSIDMFRFCWYPVAYFPRK